MTKKIEILIIENDEAVIHRSVSNVNEDVNPFTIAIQAIIEQLTGTKPALTKRAIPVINGDKFAQAVPGYVAPVPMPDVALPAAPQFHPDLVKQGVAPKFEKATTKEGIPEVKIKMSDVMRGK